MKNKAKKIVFSFFCFLLVLSFTEVRSQDLDRVKEVQHFFVGFMDNLFQGDPIVPTIVITAMENDVIGSIEYNGGSVDFALNQGEIFEHELNSIMVIETNTIIESKGVHIYSEGEISVYAINAKPGSFDGTLVLPFEKLGDDYFIASHYENQTKGIRLGIRQFNNESQVLIVATEDNTLIEVSPSAPVFNSTDAFTITMNKGETYQFKSQADLTGTRVRVLNTNGSCGRIAVFSGNKFADIGDPECGPFSTSHIFNQNEPVSSWGREFFHIPLRNRQLGELVKFIAAFDNTEVYSGDDLLATLNSGEFYTMDVPDGLALHFSSNNPMAVFGFGKSYSCLILDENSVQSPANILNYGNPQMVNYRPFEEAYTNLSLLAHRVFNTSMHYAQIVVASSDVDQMQIDGENVGNQFVPINNDPSFSYAQINLNPGVHELANPGGFMGYFYAVGASSSYALSYGQEFGNSSYEVTSTFDDFTTGSPRIACLNQEGNWGISSSNLNFNFFTWDFGDGSASKSGKNVTHTYSDAGLYEVKIYASENDTGCDETEVHYFEVEVEDIGGEVTGPQHACPQVDVFDYIFTGSGNLAQVDWSVEGGVILNQEDSVVTVQWNDPNENAKIIGIPIGINGCRGTPVELVVTINQEIAPLIPEGVDFICNTSETFIYQVTNPQPSRAYEWEVMGGTIIGDNRNPDVEILWNEWEVMGAIFYREYSLIDNLCEGFSPTLIVAINSGLEAIVSELKEVSCSGGSDGKLEIEVQGGIPPYQFIWSHDPGLDDNIAENLSAGAYNVNIKDSQSCEIQLENLIVTEPNPLEFLTIDVENVSCFGNMDGSISLRIIGGERPYSVDIESAEVNDDLIKLESLESGNYSITVLDANECQIATEVFVDSPEALEVLIETVQNPCPGENNGVLSTELIGGTGPYTYLWNNGQMTQEIEQVGSGMYEVIITNVEGCVNIGRVMVTESTPIIRMPTGFDPSEGGFGPVSNCGDLQFVLSIYNKWGELIHQGNIPWDGSVQGKPTPTGVYGYRFDYEFQINGQIERESILGTLTKIK
ncbi:SprB repeat-containing protein [Belliella buryatensis]|uniref:SprB repeat-containing protein n=1 Tax=Belliella buryatensis TaxID=1500549 RepID=A0A239DEL2_9BACT|nr:PKD domain-containing protein [Belliella buryatensis]SNS30482.1 SprB repeat-containing protein [Belliella buryatensis]